MHNCGRFSMNPFSQTCEDWDLNSPDQMFTRPNYVITQSDFEYMTMDDLKRFGEHALHDISEKFNTGIYSERQKGILALAYQKIQNFFKKDGTVNRPAMEKYFLSEFQQAEFSLMPQDYQVVPYFNDENKVLNEQISNEVAFDVVGYQQLGTDLTTNEVQTLTTKSEQESGEQPKSKMPLYIGAAALAYLMFK